MIKKHINFAFSKMRFELIFLEKKKFYKKTDEIFTKYIGVIDTEY